MTRAYALALGAGTQPFTLGIGPAVFGPSVLTHDLSLGAAWAINLGRRRVRHPPPRRPPSGEPRSRRSPNDPNDRKGQIVMTRVLQRAGTRRLPASDRRAPGSSLVALDR